MAIYRALKDLDAGHTHVERGRVFCSGLLPDAVAEKLIELGKVAVVSTPPLAILPGWKVRAGKLAPDVETAGQFIEAPDETLATKLKVTPSRIQFMKDELLGWLSVPKPQG